MMTSMARDLMQCRLTLYAISGDYCRDEMVQFDRTHLGLFERPSSEREKAYVGGLVRSVRCQVVDKSLSVSNTNGHPSTQYQVNCPGESCSSWLNCESYYVKAQCTSGKCKRTRVLEQQNLSGNVEVA